MIKLPQNPADRKKAIVALCIGGLVVAYLSFTFGLQPYLGLMQKRRARVVELEDSIWRAQKDLNALDNNLTQNTQTAGALLKASETDRHILRPSLGNYLLVATDILNKSATGLRVSIDNISEVPLPAPTPVSKTETNATSTARFAPYTVNVSLNAGLHHLVLFLNRLESTNPYVAVSRIVIMEQSAKDPETHFISLHVQWPVWLDNEHPRRLEAELIADEDRQ